MTEQSKSYYNKINKLLLKNKKTSIFTSSFLVLIGMINFEKKKKIKLLRKYFLNFFSIINKYNINKK